ncbi:MAG: Cu(I)-responsive transcriptional regulator [Lysobacteraceae bacterium]|nr:MAG: Cu(I)-responsive transcriptional regulator [Xanthomonadaceae bacterium]
MESAQRSNDMTRFSIGQVAKQAGVAIDTVRYYERTGLLEPAARLASGYRRYGSIELKRLRFIRRAKTLGFSLHDIRVLLALSEEKDIAQVKRLAQSKLQDINNKIEDLESVRTGLSALIEACPGHERAEGCPILNALSQEESA